MGMSQTWEPAAAGNFILIFKDFVLSYAPNPGMGIAVFAGDTGDETAIVSLHPEKYFVLNGDHRVELERLAINGGLTSCMEFYREHKENWSSWTQSEEQGV